jgi:hypothetical protein
MVAGQTKPITARQAGRLKSSLEFYILDDRFVQGSQRAFTKSLHTQMLQILIEKPASVPLGEVSSLFCVGVMPCSRPLSFFMKLPRTASCHVLCANSFVSFY